MHVEGQRAFWNENTVFICIRINADVAFQIQLNSSSFGFYSRAAVPFGGPVRSQRVIPVIGFEALETQNLPGMTLATMSKRRNFNRAPRGWGVGYSPESNDLWAPRWSTEEKTGTRKDLRFALSDCPIKFPAGEMHEESIWKPKLNIMTKMIRKRRWFSSVLDEGRLGCSPRTRQIH